MKTCSKCGRPEGETTFPKRGRVCNLCENTRRQEVYASDPVYREKSKTRARNRAAAKPELVRVEQRRKHLRTAYGLSLEEYDIMVAEQGDACAICGGPPTMHGRFYVDHNHVTGKLRSLLCHGCNTAIGHLKDSPVLCEKAASYLRKHGE
jgi:hypothetical protein